MTQPEAPTWRAGAVDGCAGSSAVCRSVGLGGWGSDSACANFGRARAEIDFATRHMFLILANLLTVVLAIPMPAAAARRPAPPVRISAATSRTARAAACRLAAVTRPQPRHQHRPGRRRRSGRPLRDPALEPGDYDVRAELDGFSPSVREGLVLQVGEVVDLSFSLEIAPVEQTVRVEAGAPLVNPSQTAIATIIGRHEIDDLPLNGRRFIELAALSAGVTTGGPVDPAAETSGLSVLGQRPVSNNLMVDGFDNNDRILGGPSANFSQESVREFQVLTGRIRRSSATPPAASSTSSPARAPTTSDGTAFLYYRDTALNARGHFEQVDPFGTPIALAEGDVQAGAVRRLARRAAAARSHIPVRGVREDADRQQHRDHRRRGGGGADRRGVPGRDRAGAVRPGPRRAGRARRSLLEAGAQPVGAAARRRT